MGILAERALKKIPKIPSREIHRAARHYAETHPRRKSYSDIEAYFAEKNPKI